MKRIKGSFWAQFGATTLILSFIFIITFNIRVGEPSLYLGTSKWLINTANIHIPLWTLFLGVMGIAFLFTVFTNYLKKEYNRPRAQLEYNLSYYEWYRDVMNLCREPRTLEQIQRLRQDRDLVKWIHSLEEMGGIELKEGKWALTEKGQEILDKYS